MLFCCALTFAAPAQNAAPEKKLTIETIFADGGLTGRGPENVQWCPDYSKISYVQRDDSGEHGELRFVNALTRRKGNSGQRAEAGHVSASHREH